VPRATARDVLAADAGGRTPGRPIEHPGRYFSVGTHAYNQTIYKKRRYDAINDLAAVALFSEQPMVLEVRKDLPANTFSEFVGLVKQNGAKMQFGSAGAGSTTHLACALLNARMGAEATHVPYRGLAPAMNDLIGGQIDYVCGNLGGATPYINSKQVKALALLSSTRSAERGSIGNGNEESRSGDKAKRASARTVP